MQPNDWKNESEEATTKADWTHILEQLRVPFMPEIVSWKPQTVSRDRRRSLAVPYVETQPYQERLDQVCPDWQDDYAIWFSDPQELAGRMGEKRTVAGKVFVKCRLTIAEHTRADVGECELTDENAFTSAKAQAFKRACASFGLGRYLYDLPKVWVDFDEDKGIPEGELKKLEAALRRRAANGNGATNPASGAAGQSASPTNGNGHANAPVNEQATAAAKANGQASAAAKDNDQPNSPTNSSPAAPTRGKGNATPTGSAPVSTGGKGRAAAPANEAKASPADESGPAPVAALATPATAEATPTATRSAAAAVAALDTATAAAPATDEQPLCPLHHVPLQLVITRDGKTHLLHKIEGEGYCNGEVVRPLRQN